MTDATRSRTGIVRLTSLLLGLALPSLILRDAIGGAAATGTVVAGGGALSSGDLMLVYGLAPVVAVSACVLFMAPGLLVAYLNGRHADADRWLVSSLVVSLVVVSLLAALGQALTGTAFRGGLFGWSLAGLVVAIGVLGFVLTPAGPHVARDTDWKTWSLALVIPIVMGALFAPKLYWEGFNGDGAHAFESARLLLSRPLPFWGADAGTIAGFPGTTSMLFAFPAGWFLRLFGEVDAAVRLPMLLYLPLTVSALAWVITAGRDLTMRLEDRSLVWLAVIVYAVTMAWSATYNPYAADLALPATQDTLLMVAFLGFIAAFVERRQVLAITFAILTYISLPSGFLLIGFWMLGLAVAWRPFPWRELRWLFLLMAMLVVGAALFPRVLSLLGLPGPGEEYGLGGILRYFAFLRVTDVARLGWVALAVGVVPVIAIAFWSKQDRIARALSLVALAYFLFFYVQAYVSLHHFVPTMLLSIAVLWRVVPQVGSSRRQWVFATALGGIVSLMMAWPDHYGAHLEGRRVGHAIWNRVPGYDRSHPEPFAAVALMTQVFPLPWDPGVPSRYGGSPLAWQRYARSEDGPGINYIVQRSTDAAPPAAHLLSDSAGFALYVRSDSVLREHQRLTPHSPPGSRWLAVPRSTLFRTVPPPAGTRVIDVAAVLKSLGVPVDALITRSRGSP